MFKIKQIEPENTYKIRNIVLRPNWSIEDCKYETDKWKGTFHLGAFYKDELVSIASFSLENYPDFNIKDQYRLKGMATLHEYQTLGAGSLIVKHAENLMKERGIYFLWCKGRVSVLEYYKKLGFKTYGEMFYYEPSGDHFILYKDMS